MANHHPSPTMMQMQQHQPPPSVAQPQNVQPGHFNPSHQVAAMNEAVWMSIGSFSEVLRVPDEAMHAYERALQANPNSTLAMNAIGMLLKGREAFDKALEFFRAIVQLDQNNGEAWGNLGTTSQSYLTSSNDAGHCYLMTENLQKAYDAYQQALMNLRDPKDPMLWYGIGILYDRYGSYDYAEEAFSQVMQIQPDFEKANEIYFRLGIIYKQQSKFNQSLECFKYIVNSPPGPLTQEDIWFQIGHVHEQQKDFDGAKAAYQRVLDHSPSHAKVLQQLGWLHHQQSNSYESQERAIQFLEKSVAADNQDAQSWYLLGRCYMSQQKYPKAYEAYQQAVYRDGKNPTFWCSIGVLYYQINQYRDALDAYSRAIRLNPYISEVWYDLGTLYESCNNQIADALDAYQRAAELDPGNPHIKARLQLLRSGASNGGPPPAAPQPADVHPHTYQVGPTGPSGPQWGGSAQQPPANGPQPAQQGAGETWVGRLSSVNPPPQPPNPYENRGEPFRGGPAPPLQRQPSPQQEPQLRQPYSDPNRAGHSRRGPSPPPPAPHQYAQPPPPPPHPSQSQPSAPAPAERRVVNPNWGGSTPSASAPPPGNANGGNPPPNSMAPFRTASSPRTDGRPVHDNRMPSPKSAYPQHQAPPPHYPHHPELPPPNAPENGHAPPSMPESSVQRMDDRPSSVGPKRLRDWEEESAPKKQANEENRVRLEDMRHRRPSTPPRDAYRRNSSEVRRADDQRRPEEPPRRSDEPRHKSENYHPSEAAHHPQSHSVGSSSHLPPMQQGPSSMQAPPVHEKPQPSLPPKEERPAQEQPPSNRSVPQVVQEPERAARKMEVDEDYDDSGEDDKKSAALSNGPGPAAASADLKTSPTAVGVNGSSGPAPKAE